MLLLSELSTAIVLEARRSIPIEQHLVRSTEDIASEVKQHQTYS